MNQLLKAERKRLEKKDAEIEKLEEEIAQLRTVRSTIPSQAIDQAKPRPSVEMVIQDKEDKDKPEPIPEDTIVLQPYVAPADVPNIPKEVEHKSSSKDKPYCDVRFWRAGRSGLHVQKLHPTHIKHGATFLLPKEETPSKLKWAVTKEIHKAYAPKKARWLEAAKACRKDKCVSENPLEQLLPPKSYVFSTYSYSLLCMRNVLDSSGIGNE